MPKEGISIYFDIKDGASQVLTIIGDKTKALDKETQELAQSYAALQKVNDPLIKQINELKSAKEKQAKVVADLRKEYRKYGDEVTKLKLDEAVAEYDEMTRAIGDHETALKSNIKTQREYQETIRKGGASTSSISGSGGDTSLSGIAKGLISGQLGQMFANSLGGLAESALTSAIGTPEASLISGTLSSAISGAAIGSIIPGLGTAIGAGVGALSGLISGGTEIFEAQDDAFKEYYTGLYDDVNASTEDMISSGSTIAGSREQTRRAFVKRFGSEEEADAYLDQVKTLAAGTNYDYDEITGYSKLLLNTYAPEEVFSVLQSLSDATAGLSLSSSDVEMFISGLSRMRTTGKTTQEYLNYFSERGLDVYSALGSALGVDKSQIAGMVTKGEIGGETAAQAILDFIDREYGGLSGDLMSTYDAISANLEDVMSNLEAAAGEGYNTLRGEGKQADIDAYSGALGEAMEEINRISGENKAFLENLSGQYTREALSAVLLGEETTLDFSDEQKTALADMAAAYEEASALYNEGNQEAGLTMERLREDAEALATAAYESSQQYQTYMDEQLTQIAEIRDNTASMAASLNEYRLGQEKSKGFVSLSGIMDGTNGLADSMYIYVPESSELSYSAGYFGGGSGLADASSHAFGLDRVPYDDYPVRLHEGERVLTAAEARAQDAGTGGAIIQVSVTGNSFYGGTEAMADQVAEAIARRLEEAAVLAVPR